MDYPKFIVSNQKEESISIQRVNYPCTHSYLEASLTVSTDFYSFSVIDSLKSMNLFIHMQAKKPLKYSGSEYI